MITKEEASRRVKNGMAFLGDRVSKINTKTLDLADATKCVLSQVYNTTYEPALEMLGLNDKQAVEYGFNGDSNSNSWGSDCVLLTQVWKELLKGKDPMSKLTINKRTRTVLFKDIPVGGKYMVPDNADLTNVVYQRIEDSFVSHYPQAIIICGNEHASDGHMVAPLSNMPVIPVLSFSMTVEI